MDHAPVIRLKHAAVIFEWLVQYWSIDRDGGIIDPSIKSSEPPDRFVGDVLHVVKIGDIAGNVTRLATGGIDLVRDAAQRLFISRIEDETRTAFRSHPRGYQSDTGGRASNNHCLL